MSLSRDSIMLPVRSFVAIVLGCLLAFTLPAAAQPTPLTLPSPPDEGGEGRVRGTALYKRIKTQLDAVPAIDTHDHLWPFDRLPAFVETEHGKGMSLYGVWAGGYYR